uniref:anthranilate synthase component 2 n=1 Tax=Chroodactylon ornatum TaxID=139907 RepID=UPI001FCDEAE4|nr:anthranilate synthase component 2 [Chroodactylon ornatum]UNJ14603.1 anthranilate synthase component 2 [Chroodactylon ornatum]
MILIIDNYDSFTYNLVQFIEEIGYPTRVIRNDQMSSQQIELMNPSKILISPGPGKPSEAGCSLEIIEKLYQKIPILGVCLGHQSIGSVFGGEIIRAEELMHGKTSSIFHNETHIFANIQSPFVATRYHSLIIEANSKPSELERIAWTSDQTIMGVSHIHFKHLIGIQFHPESLWTPLGKQMLQNFLNF